MSLSLAWSFAQQNSGNNFRIAAITRPQITWLRQMATQITKRVMRVLRGLTRKYAGCAKHAARNLCRHLAQSASPFMAQSADLL
jgi:hypothetical protein